MKKVCVVFGTRPEAIKMAPVVKELERSPWFEPRVVVTAQHREMLDQVLELFNITPHHDLDIMRFEQTLFDITARVLTGLGAVFASEKPDAVLVHGDTSTTFAGSLAAYYLQIPVGHVEAGLRTGNKYSPFPEEMNRHLTGVLTDVHLAPTAGARANLLAEGVDDARIYVTGNTVIDALLDTAARPFRFMDPELAQTEEPGRRMLLVTTHRRENLGAPLAGVYRALKRILDRHSDTLVVFPVHKNPAVRRVVEQELGGQERVILTEPLPYLEFVNLMKQAALVLTDSGGLQEEAPSLGKPVLVLRDTTERPEAVDAGTVRLVGTDEEAVFQTADELLSSPEAYRRMAEAVNPYGDGQGARRTVQGLAHYMGLAPRGTDFETSKT